MRSLFIAGVCLLLISFIPGTYSDVQKAGLKGKVRSVENWTTDTKKQKGNLKRIRKNEWNHDSSRCLVIYDEYGKVIEAVYLDADSMQQQRDDYRYDIDGRLDVIMLNVSDHADFPPKVDYHYNKNGQLRTVGYYISGSANPTAEYWYDYNDKGYISTVYEGTVGIKYNVIIEYKYDLNGHVIQVDNEDGDNQLKAREAYKYDSTGNLLEDILYKGDGTSVMEQKELSYNEDGKKVEEMEYFPDGQFTRQENKLERKQTSIDSIKKIWEYYYDYKVVEETESTYPSEDIKTTRDSLAFQYDSIGNWIKKSHYYSSKDSSIVYRLISYY